MAYHDSRLEKRVLLLEDKVEKLEAKCKIQKGFLKLYKVTARQQITGLREDELGILLSRVTALEEHLTKQNHGSTSTVNGIDGHSHVPISVIPNHDKGESSKVGMTEQSPTLTPVLRAITASESKTNETSLVSENETGKAHSKASKSNGKGKDQLHMKKEEIESDSYSDSDMHTADEEDEVNDFQLGTNLTSAKRFARKFQARGMAEVKKRGEPLSLAKSTHGKRSETGMTPEPTTSSIANQDTNSLSSNNSRPKVIVTGKEPKEAGQTHTCSKLIKGNDSSESTMAGVKKRGRPLGKKSGKAVTKDTPHKRKRPETEITTPEPTSPPVADLLPTVGSKTRNSNSKELVPAKESESDEAEKTSAGSKLNGKGNGQHSVTNDETDDDSDSDSDLEEPTGYQSRDPLTSKPRWMQEEHFDLNKKAASLPPSPKRTDAGGTRPVVARKSKPGF